MKTDTLIIKIADSSHIAEIRRFFLNHLQRADRNMYSEEFFCMNGVSAAVKRDQMIVSCNGITIIGACRVYQKKNGEVSLYQFAINESYRGQGLLFRMLEQLGSVKVVTKCRSDVGLNDYYKKTGWSLERSSQGFNYWNTNPQLFSTKD